MKKILVATWFFAEQPGFLDFSYRLNALVKHYDTRIILRDACFMKEFPGLESACEVLPQANTSHRGLLRYVLRLRALILAEQPDLVVLLGSSLALLQALLPKQRCVVYWNEHPTHFYDVGQRSLLKRWFNRGMMALTLRGARLARRLMVIGEAFRDDILAQGADPARVRLIYMGVSPDFRQHHARHGPRGEISVVYTGTVAVDRGRDIMIEGLALARQRGAKVRLTLIGANPEEAALCRTRAAALGLGKAFTVQERIPGSAIPGVLRDFDAGVCIWADQPWWQFNPPTKLFEYLVAGLPVLASDIRTHTAYIEEGRNGLIFPYSAEGLAEVLSRLTPPLLAGLHRGALASSAAYLWPTVEPTFLACIEEALHD